MTSLQTRLQGDVSLKFPNTCMLRITKCAHNHHIAISGLDDQKLSESSMRYMPWMFTVSTLSNHSEGMKEIMALHQQAGQLEMEIHHAISNNRGPRSQSARLVILVTVTAKAIGHHAEDIAKPVHSSIVRSVRTKAQAPERFEEQRTRTSPCLKKAPPSRPKAAFTVSWCTSV